MILFAQPKEWWLEISSPQQAEFWEQSQQHITSNKCWNDYINRVCLYPVVDLIKDNAPSASICLGANKMSAVWNVVNAGVTQTIKFQFGGQQSERFSIEVACLGKVITEHFVI